LGHAINSEQIGDPGIIYQIDLQGPVKIGFRIPSSRLLHNGARGG
jgi:hypothetical protein